MHIAETPRTEYFSQDIQGRKRFVENIVWKCCFISRQLAHADEMSLPAKVREDLVKFYYQNDMNAAEFLCVDS